MSNTEGAPEQLPPDADSRSLQSNTKGTPNQLPHNADSRLLKLPPELRNIIYRFTLHEPDDIVIPYKDQPPPQPALLRTCREIRGDAIKIYYEENTFSFQLQGFDATRMIAWSRSSKLHAACVKKGTVTLPPSYRPWDDLFVWLKAFYHGEVVGMCVEDETGDFAIATQLFLMVKKMKDERSLVGPENWSKVEGLLVEMREVLSECGLEKWKRVDSPREE